MERRKGCIGAVSGYSRRKVKGRRVMAPNQAPPQFSRLGASFPPQDMCASGNAVSDAAVFLSNLNKFMEYVYPRVVHR